MRVDNKISEIKVDIFVFAFHDSLLGFNVPTLLHVSMGSGLEMSLFGVYYLSYSRIVPSDVMW